MIFQNITVRLEFIKRDSAFLCAVGMAIGTIFGENRLDVFVKLCRTRKFSRKCATKLCSKNQQPRQA